MATLTDSQRKAIVAYTGKELTGVDAKDLQVLVEKAAENGEWDKFLYYSLFCYNSSHSGRKVHEYMSWLITDPARTIGLFVEWKGWE